jgi:hypothetical protein
MELRAVWLHQVAARRPIKRLLLHTRKTCVVSPESPTFPPMSLVYPLPPPQVQLLLAVLATQLF